MNTFGNNLRLTTFGESHGPAIGGVIDGFPPGFRIDFSRLQEELDRRSPGISQLVSQRKESDQPEFLSGISYDGITLGTPIGFIIRNNDGRSQDYRDLEEKFRPNHADYTYQMKYGIRDFRGGGRASARETANWVVAGALALQWLENVYKISIESILSGAGDVSFKQDLLESLANTSSKKPELSLSENQQQQIAEEINKAKFQGDSIGGFVTCLIKGVPVGLGSPVADKLQSRLAQAMMSINAAKGFEYGAGMTLAEKKGSEVIDTFRYFDEVFTETNFSGGIQGGISNGMPIFFNVAFKPTPSIMREVNTINIRNEATTLQMKGRHDPCVALRAVPVVKAMTALVIADFLL